MPPATKAFLEELLRSRQLQAGAPPLRGEDRRLTPLPTGIPEVDGLLGGGFPRGRMTEVHGPASSGRTGLALGFLARTTRCGALAAWVDPADRLDPASAAVAGVDLARLLWLRGEPRDGRALSDALAATGTLLGSGLFEAVGLDLAGVPDAELRRLPGATWIRLQRMVEETPAVLMLLARAHAAPGSLALALEPTGPRWSGGPGPGRLLRGLAAQALTGRHAPRRATFELRAFA
jgi:hypothetical protein